MLYQCIHLFNQPNSQYQIHINNRGTAAICFGKYTPSSGSICGTVQSCYMYSLKVVYFYQNTS